MVLVKHDPTSTLGSLIKFQRIVKGYDQAALAKRMGVTVAAVSKWENNISKPRDARLHVLATVLELPVSLLIEKAEAAA